MITIQARDMSDDKWKSVAKLEDLSMKNIDAEQWGVKETDWKALRDDTLNSHKISEIPFSNIYYLFDENNAVSFIEAFERRARLLKTDLDFSNLQIIIDSNKIAQSYELQLFHNIPEKMYDRFMNYMDEVNGQW